MSKHTKTPWDNASVYSSGGVVPLQIGRPVVAVMAGECDVAYMANCFSHDEAVANAAFIVRACNSHAALVAACERVISAKCPRDTNGDGDCGQPICPWCGDGIRAALALAKP